MMMKSRVMGNAMVVATLLLSMLLRCAPAHSASFTVGDAKGWSFGVAGWENGKNFKVFDTIVFKYNPSFHNVVIVDKAAYDSCIVPPNSNSNSITFNSGNEQLVLKQGLNYFICGKPGHCQAGMKIAAFAA